VDLTGPAPALRRGVAKDRRISVEVGQMRHGRKPSRRSPVGSARRKPPATGTPSAATSPRPPLPSASTHQRAAMPG
jgi:hypothetical protein